MSAESPREAIEVGDRISIDDIPTNTHGFVVADSAFNDVCLVKSEETPKKRDGAGYASFEAMIYDPETKQCLPGQPVYVHAGAMVQVIQVLKPE